MKIISIILLLVIRSVYSLSARITAHADDAARVLRSDDYGEFEEIYSEDFWKNAIIIDIDNVDENTVLRFEVEDNQAVVGGFIATIDIDGDLYYTTDPITDGNFELISSSDNIIDPLVYSEKGSSPWSITTEGIDDNAVWIWNGQLQNTMIFEFSFDVLKAYTNTRTKSYGYSPEGKYSPSSSSSSSGGGIIHGDHKHRCRKGTIQMYFGGYDDLPDGYRICNGKHGTVDLRGRFPIGVDQKHYDYGKCGGNKYININQDQMPKHHHDFKEVTVSSSGEHYHEAEGIIKKAGKHKHKHGSLHTLEAGKHDHYYETTSNEGEHSHDFDLMTDYFDDHNHGIKVSTSTDGNHAHNNDFAVDKDGIHTHSIQIEIEKNGIHNHEFKGDDIVINIPDHEHGVGTYHPDDHEFNHKHSVTGTTTADGSHYHSFSTTSEQAGTHDHPFSLYSDSSGIHNHDEGDLKTSKDGKHPHDIAEYKTEKDGDHDHTINAYFESDYNTYSYDKLFDLALDNVDKNQEYTLTTGDESDHCHVIPATSTLENGDHDHLVNGTTGDCDEHKHNVDGTIEENGSHTHGVKGNTSSEDNHNHDVDGMTDEIDITLSHILSGSCEPDGSYSTTIAITGSIEYDGQHDHIATGTIMDAGLHTHPLSGDIKEDGIHDHEIDDNTEDAGGHKHDIEGTISAGSHTHEIKGRTDKNGNHKHEINGETDYSGLHTHDIEITIEKAGLHTHLVDGTTCKVGEGDPVMILPPYVAVHFICCTNEDELYSTSSSSSSSSSGYNSYKQSTSSDYIDDYDNKDIYDGNQSTDTDYKDDNNTDDYTDDSGNYDNVDYVPQSR